MEMLIKIKENRKHIICALVLAAFAIAVMCGSYIAFIHGRGDSAEKIRDSYSTFCMVVMAVVTILFITVYLLWSYAKVAIEKIYLICGLTMGILFLFLIPPYVTPDEDVHWVSAYEVSNHIMNIDMEPESEIGIIMRSCDQQVRYTSYANRDYYNYLLNGMLEKTGDTTLVEQEVVMSGVLDVFYLFPALGITIGRLLGLNGILTAFLAAFCNMLFFVGCSYYAMKKLPFGKMVLFSFCLLPMTLQLTSSVSYDNILLATMVVIVSLSLHWGYGNSSIKKSEVILYLLAAYILLVGKGGTYAILCFLPFVLKCTKEKINRRNVGIVAGFIALAVIVVLSAGMLAKYTAAGGSGTAADAENAGRAYIAWADSYGYTLKELITQPKMVLGILMTTILVNVDFYVETMLGSPLGWLSIEIPNVVIYAFLFVLIAAAIRNKGEEIHFRISDKIGIWVMCCISCGISVAAMLLYWTPMDSGIVMGVQGRYFLPVLFPFLLTLRGKRVEWKENCDMQLSVAVIFLEMMTVFFLLRAFV